MLYDQKEKKMKINHRNEIVFKTCLIALSLFFILVGTRLQASALDFCSGVSEIPLTECQALDALYNDTDGANWTNNTNWLSTTTPSNWYGVTVTDGNVTNINLAFNQLDGNIPSELGNLANLLTLQLGNNQLSGSIPSVLGSLTNLTSLYLQANQLSGSIPSALGSMSNLVILDLTNNWLTSNIPTELSSLSNLESLKLYDNQLVGSIPSSLGSLSNLKSLKLYNNQLTGSIPSSLGNLSNLQELFLNYNLLTGNIPTTLGGLSNLRKLYLDNNQLSGGIPTALGSLSNLINLRLYNNQLTGSIPPILGSLSNLLYLSLDNNRLTGGIPTALGSLSNLLSLYLDNNQLTGSIPVELASLSNLQFLVMHGNQLSGSIPAVLGNLSNLQSIKLYSNQLTGGIPSSLGNLSNLRILSLYNNQLSGIIPTELGNLSNLFDFYLYNNQLSSRIPTTLTNLTNLYNFQFNNTNLCEPQDATFQTWLSNVPNVVSTGYSCTPTLTSPGNSTTDSTPEYAWTDIGTAKYGLIVYSGGTATEVVNVILTASGICSAGSCEYTPTTLLTHGSYKFKVRGFRGSWYPWSAWSTFDYGPPDSPTLISPSVKETDSTPMYKWNESIGASKYRLMVYSNDTSSYVLNKVLQASSACSSGVCAYTPVDPLIPGSYKFKVRSYNLAGWSPFSSWMNFTHGPPAAPTLISPTGAIISSTPTYKWNASAGATVYNLIVYSDTTSSFILRKNVGASTYCSGGACSYKPSTPLALGDYRFRVKAYNLAGWSPLSQWMSFIYGAPPAPTLFSPSGTIIDSTPTYKWKPVATATLYRLTVKSETGTLVFTQLVSASTACSSGLCSYTSSTPLPQGDYKFKVSAKNLIGWGPASAWMNFKYGPPDAPTLISPSDFISDTTPTYKWNVSDGAIRYKLIVYSHTTSSTVVFANLHYSSICSGGVCSYTPTTTLSAGKYHFTVRAYNIVGWGPVSTWKVFDVVTNLPTAPTLFSPNGTIAAPPHLSGNRWLLLHCTD
jgi:Leucine-rich repeat (LRR) protein